jgi:hypothetical protein
MSWRRRRKLSPLSADAGSAYSCCCGGGARQPAAAAIPYRGAAAAAAATPTPARCGTAAADFPAAAVATRPRPHPPGLGRPGRARTDGCPVGVPPLPRAALIIKHLCDPKSVRRCSPIAVQLQGEAGRNSNCNAYARHMPGLGFKN